MAQKRMFSMHICDSDAFLDLPQSSQNLYFHLNMRADDDGFVGNPKRIIKLIGANDDDMRILIAKRFVLIFESGVIVIKHWRMHNTIKNDRYTPTVYQDELQQLEIKENKSYTLTGNILEPKWNQNGTTGLGLGLGSGLGLEESGKKKFIKPTIEEVKQFISDNNYNVDPARFFNYYESNGWKVGGRAAMKDWKAAIRNWNAKEKPRKEEDNDPFA